MADVGPEPDRGEGAPRLGEKFSCALLLAVPVRGQAEVEAAEPDAFGVVLLAGPSQQAFEDRHGRLGVTRLEERDAEVEPAGERVGLAPPCFGQSHHRLEMAARSFEVLRVHGRDPQDVVAGDFLVDRAGASCDGDRLDREGARALVVALRPGKARRAAQGARDQLGSRVRGALEDSGEGGAALGERAAHPPVAPERAHDLECGLVVAEERCVLGPDSKVVPLGVEPRKKPRLLRARL